MKSRNEELCRVILTQLLKKSFPTKKPKWLTYKDKRLELDGYNSEIGIAFEYDGEQHYKKHKLFNNLTTNEIQKRDRIKDKLCKENGVLLLRIPFTLNKNNIIKHITRQLKPKKIIINQGKISAEIDTLYTIFRDNEIKDIIKKHDGVLISGTFFTRKTKDYAIRCKEGHIFKTSYEILSMGCWCNKCGHIKIGKLKQNKILKKCIICHKKIITIPALKDRKKYCSNKCFKKSKIGKIPWNKGLYNKK